MAGKTTRSGGRATRATPTAANRGAQSRPGDATGMENERLRKENEQAIRAAATTTTLVNPPPVVEVTDQVIDYSEGGNANIGSDDEGARLISLDEATTDGQTRVETYLGNGYDTEDTDLDSLPDGTVDVLPEILEQRPDEPPPAHGQRRDSQQPVSQRQQPQVGVQRAEAPVVEEAYRVLRVNTDLEDITIGKDNHFTFRVGQPYKVQVHVYNHLAEKGYVLR